MCWQSRIAPLKLEGIQGQKRVSHHAIADRMGVAAQKFTTIIRDLIKEDPQFGQVIETDELQPTHNNGHTTKHHFWLDEHQALSVVFESRSPSRHAVKNEVISMTLG